MNGVPYVVAAYGFVGVLFASWVGIMVRRNARRGRDGAGPNERR
jgi:hypothetical protein